MIPNVSFAKKPVERVLAVHLDADTLIDRTWKEGAGWFPSRVVSEGVDPKTNLPSLVLDNGKVVHRNDVVIRHEDGSLEIMAGVDFFSAYTCDSVFNDVPQL